MNYTYKEIVIGNLQKGARSQGKIIKTCDLYKAVNWCNEHNKELYASYYNYSEEILKHYDKFKSIKEYQGKIAIDKIYLDYDISLEKFQEIVLNLPHEYCKIYFSGTGFHVHMENIYGFEPAEGLHLLVKENLSLDFKEADNIYDKTRIIRIANTINIKSNLYKTQIDISKIINADSIDEIKNLSKTYTIAGIEFNQDRDIPILRQIRKPIINTIIIDKGHTENTKIATCIHDIYNLGPIVGTRNARILRMVSVFRRAGVPRDGIIKMLTTWSGLPIKDVLSRVNSVFDTPLEYGCHDPILSAFCHSDCIFFKNKDLAITKNIKELEKDFINFIAQEQNNIINLKKYFAIPYDYKFYPGEFVMVIGDTGIGKTAFLQNLCILNNMPTLYLSLEVSSHLLFRRFAQIKHKMSKDDLIRHYISNKNGMTEGLEHLTCQFIGPKMEALEKIISSINPKVIVIDTLDGIHVPQAKDSMYSMDRLAITLKELAHKYNLIIFGVHHISKQASYGGQLTVHSGKGSSTLEQKADKLIAIEGEKDSPIRTIRSLKARDESSFILSLNYNFETFTYDPI